MKKILIKFKHEFARVMAYKKWVSTAHPWIYRIVKFNIILAIKLSGGGVALSFIGLSKGLYMVSQMPTEDIIFCFTDLNWKKIVAIGGFLIGVWAIWKNMDKFHNWINKKPPELPPSLASRESFNNKIFQDERVGKILAEEAAIKKGELAGKARLALINDAIKHKISQKVIDDVCEEVVPAKVSDVMDKGNLSVIDDEVLKNINFEDSKFIREKISNIEKKKWILY